MKISAEDLKRTLHRLSPVSSEFTVFSGGFLYGTDAELTIRAKGFDLGEFSVASKTLSQIASRLSKDVSIEFDPKGTLAISSGRSRFKLNTVKPVIPKMPEITTSFEVPLSELKAALAYASMATDSSMRFSYESNILLSENKAVATDGRRLAMFTTGFKAPKILLPSRAAMALGQIQSESDVVKIGESATALLFSSENVVLQTQKLAKEFCNYESVLPKSFSFSTVLKADELKVALARVSPVGSGDQTHKVRLRFEGGICSLDTADAVGAASDELSYPVEGDPLFAAAFEVVLNHRHLADFVGGIKGDIKFEGNDRQVMLSNGPKSLLMMALKK